MMLQVGLAAGEVALEVGKHDPLTISGIADVGQLGRVGVAGPGILTPGPDGPMTAVPVPLVGDLGVGANRAMTASRSWRSDASK